MRNTLLILLFFAICGFPNWASAQAILTTDTISVECKNTDVILVPVKVQNFTNIGSFQFTLKWNTAELQYLNVRNFNPDFTVGTVNIGFDTSAVFIGQGQLTFSWTRFGGASFAGKPTVFHVAFKRLKGGFSPVSFGNAPVLIEVTDRNGNELPTQVSSGGVRALDREKPTIVCPSSVTQQVSAPTPLPPLTPTAGDDCGIKNLSWSATGVTTVNPPVTGSIGSQPFNIGSSVVTYTAEDFAGNTASCTFSVNYTLGGGTDVTVVAGGGSATCGESLCLPISVRNFTGMGSIQFSLKWNSQLLRFDSVSTVGSAVTLAATNFGATRTANGELTFNWTTDQTSIGTTLNNDALLFRLCFSATGGQSTPTSLEFTDTPSVREAYRARPLTEIPMVTINGSLNLTDNVPPTIKCPNNAVVSAAAGTVSASVVGLDPIASDNCGGIPRVRYARTGATTGTGTDSANGDYAAGTTTVMYTATDIAGNTTACSFTVTVNANGVLSVKLDTLGVACNSNTNTLTYDVKVRNFSNLLGMQFTVKWDTSALEFTQPITNVYTGLNLTAASFLGYTTTPQGTLQFLGGNGSTGWPNIPDGGTMFSLTFKVKKPNAVSPIRFEGPFDAVNTSFQSVNFLTFNGGLRMSDVTPPVLANCPSNVERSAEGNCKATLILPLPTATDDCSGVSGSVRSTAPADNGFNPGQTVVVFTATDRAGNSATCSTTVTVRDNVAPVISNCPNSLSVTLPTNKCDTVFTWTPPTAFDNCGTARLTSTATPGVRLQAGSRLVFYTATDEGGNSASCSFTLSAIDRVKPVFNRCPKDTIIANAPSCGILLNWAIPTATDNCDANPRVTASRMPRDTFFAGTTNVLIFAQDASNNFDTCRFKVTVNALANQGFAGIPTNITLPALQDSCGRRVSWTPPRPVGFCRTPRLRTNFEPNSVFPVGTTTVIYTADDQSGQSTTATFTVTITETMPPVFTACPQPVTVNIGGIVMTDASRIISSADTASACKGVRLTLAELAATDNCGRATVRQTSGPQGVFAIGTHSMSFVATDASGNSSVCSFLVTVQGLEALKPVVSPNVACVSDQGQVTIRVPDLAGAAYTWRGPNGPITNNTPSITIVSSFQNSGLYTVFGTVKGCSTPLDSARIVLAQKPDAIDDGRIEFMTGELDTFNVLTNDKFTVRSDVQVTQKTSLDGVTYMGNGKFSYQAGNESKEVSFTYEICSKACPDLCDIATVTLKVIDSQCAFVPNVISPNGDDVNDYLVVPCLDSNRYPNSSMTIFNKWGDVVYKAQPYSNDKTVAWQGTLNNEPGRDLPDGVYYYIFKPSADQPALKGFVQIMR